MANCELFPKKLSGEKLSSNFNVISLVQFLKIDKIINDLKKIHLVIQ